MIVVSSESVVKIFRIYGFGNILIVIYVIKSLFVEELFSLEKRVNEGVIVKIG